MNEIAEFTIVQCVPDPIADERINIGVIVLVRDEVLVRFIQRWGRVKSFSGNVNIGHVKDFVEAMELTANGVPATPQYLPMFSSNIPNPADSIRDMINNWSHTIQFTPLQPSLEAPRRLLYRLSDRYLKEPAGRKAPARSKSQVITTAVNSLKGAIQSTSPAEPILDHPLRAKARATATGQRVKEVQMDFALVNESPLAGGQAISFQLTDMAELKAQRQQAVWSLADLMSFDRALRTSIMVAPPSPDVPSFRSAGREYAQFRIDATSAGIEIVEEADAESWAEAFTREALATRS